MADWKMGGAAGLPIGSTPLPVDQGGLGNATGDASALVVTPTGASTARTVADIAGDVESLAPSWTRIVTPFLIGHRGVIDYLPENTIPAWDEAASLRAPIEMDVVLSSDGFPVSMHDATVDRTTDGTGNVVDMTLAQLRALDASATIPGYPATQVPTFDEYLVRYGHKCLLAIEAKVVGTGETIAVEVTRRGLVDSTLVHSFYDSEIVAVQAVNPSIRTMKNVFPGSPLTPAQLVALGVDATGVPAAEATAEYVASCHAVGIQVISYQITTVAIADAQIANGVDGMMIDDLPYYRKFAGGLVSASGLSPGLPTRFPASGWYGQMTGRVLASVAGYATFASGVATDGVNSYICPPVRTPAGSYVIDVTLKLVSRAADTSRYIGMRFGWSLERDIVAFGGAGATGYYFITRANGTAAIGRAASGTPTELVTNAAWATLAEGDVVPLRITVTPTTITVLRTDNGNTITVTDATYGRSGWVSAMGVISVVGLKPVMVTY